MPELPDLTVYVEHLADRLVGQPLRELELRSPFLLRPVEPGIDAFVGVAVADISLIAKQVCISFRGDLHAVIHLMISGRFQWRESGKKDGGRNVQAIFRFDSGALLLTEASKKKRASLRLVEGASDLTALHPGGADVLSIALDEFSERLRTSNHTLKRALTDQRVLAGVGNAYSDEILLAAKLSPFKRASQLSDEQMHKLFDCSKSVLRSWIERLRKENSDAFPAKVTAFHPDMAAHGKYNEPCPVCASPIQRIRYAENEANYCATCQTDGRLLADRSLSRLLKDNWPKRLEDLERK